MTADPPSSLAAAAKGTAGFGFPRRARPDITGLHSMFRVSWPLSISYMGHVVIGATDAAMFGRLGAEYLAAASLALAIFMPVLLFSLGFVMPVQPLIAQARGGRRQRRIRGILLQGLWMALLVSIPCCLALTQVERFLLLTGQDAALAALAGEYMNLFLWSLPFLLILVVFRYFMVSFGRPGWAAAIMCGAMLLNVPMDYLLIFGAFGLPGYGVVGGAAASVLVSAGAALAAALVAITRPHFRRHTPFARFRLPDWRLLFRFFHMGWPISLHMVAENGLITVCALLAGMLGTQAVAVYAIVLNLAELGYITAVGLSDAAGAAAAFSFGRGDMAGVLRTVRSALLLGAAFVVLPALAYLLLPETVAAVFLKQGDENAAVIIKTAAGVIPILTLLLLFSVAQMVLIGVLRGMSDMKVPGVMAAVIIWTVGFGGAVIFAFPLQAGTAGLFWGMTLSGAVIALCFALRLKYIVNSGRRIAL